MDTPSTAAFTMYITFYIALTLLSIVWIYSIITRYCRISVSSSDYGPSAIFLFSSSKELRHGLEASVLKTFPKFAYSDTDMDTGLKMKTNGECVVCLGVFEKDELLRLLPKCGHIFHADCVDTWLRSHATCPFCRANLLANDSPSTEFVVDMAQQTRRGLMMAAT